MGESLRAELRARDDDNRIRVTLIEPGMVDTPFFDNRPGDRALERRGHRRGRQLRARSAGLVDVNEILIRPIGQGI